MIKWYKSPSAMSLEDWDRWHAETKSKYPVQYFLRNDVVDFYNKILYKLHNAKWWFLHRYHPSHRYNHVHIRDLKPDYYDPETRITHMIFQEVTDYAATLRSDGYKGTRWTLSELEEDTSGILAKQVENELKAIEIADWWKEYKLAQETMWDRVPTDTPEGVDEDSILWVLYDKHKDTPEYEAWKKATDEVSRVEEEWEEKKKEKLKEVIDILDNLWYP